jgi:transcriptional regulator with XRE-family HTH domain
MGYPEQFQAYREGRGLTREQLATRAECHRNTVINVESGRPVRFATVIHLMQHLGYTKESPEVRVLALAWLESVTGVRIDEPAKRRADDQPSRISDASGQRRAGLARADAELLAFAARNRKVLNALRAIRDLVDEPVGPRPT